METSRQKLEGERQRHAEDGGSADDSGRTKVPKRVKRLMFVSFVQGAVLSGLTSMTLEPRHCAHLDRVLLGMLRSLSGETAHQTWRGTRQEHAISFLGIAAGS